MLPKNPPTKKKNDKKAHSAPGKEPKSYQKKDSIIDLSPLINKQVRVKFAGGRELTGILKGFDPLVNLVLDDAVEQLRDPVDLSIITSNTRQIGLVVCRGTSVIFISPLDGYQPISNPFVSRN